MTVALIASHETEIRGEWIMVGSKVEADDQCRRIEHLVAQYLREVGRDATGWDRLLVDPQDGRYWELTYPESELHGGGPPRLHNIQKSEARAKYGHVEL